MKGDQPLVTRNQCAGSIQGHGYLLFNSR